MQGDPACLSEFSFGDVEQVKFAVEVLECQGKSLADADSRGIQKAEKGLVGMRPQRLGRR